MRIPIISRYFPAAPQVAVIWLYGAIGGGQGRNLTDSSLADVVERAFTKGRPTAVALSINSPGGSPVQSSLIAARIRRLADTKKVPVYAFVEDMAASGGYWLACAGDEIWADRSSVLGSLGVISAGFGFHDLIDRWGIERRVHTSGESKSTLDPFQPEKPEDVARLRNVMVPIHDAFKAHVRASRGDRLAEDQDLFTGAFWAADEAIKLGLADGIGHLVPKMKSIYGDKTKFRIFAPRVSLMRRLGLSADAVFDTAEERLAYMRYGPGR